VVSVVIAVLVAGAVSVLYLPGLLNPKKIKVVDVVIPRCQDVTSCRFSPKNITVKIGVNNTVRWTNIALDPIGFPHTVTEGIPVANPTGSPCLQRTASSSLGSFYCPAATPLFDSGDVQRNGTFTHTFTIPGVYEYFCVYHPGMIGFVIVKQ
jgi:plastocyanin